MNGIEVTVVYRIAGRTRRAQYWTTREAALDLEEFEPGFVAALRMREELSRSTPIEVVQVEL